MNTPPSPSIDPSVRSGRSIALKTSEVTLEGLADLVVVAPRTQTRRTARPEGLSRCWAEFAVIDRQYGWSVESRRSTPTLPAQATTLAVAESIVNTKESGT